jgi:site-specific DNA-methyltransferase (adenine-specific)
MPVAESPLDDFGDDARGEGLVYHADNLAVLSGFADESFTLIYLDPPFNTGRPQQRRSTTASRVGAGGHPDAAAAPALDEASAPGDEPVKTPGRYAGFKGRLYDRIKGDLLQYDDRFDDYWQFLEPRLVEAWRLLSDDGTLYLHLDYREAHYAKVLLDALFGRESFLNEIIWAYDYGAKSKNRWPTKHDTILVYVKNPAAYHFDSETVDREPYMAPGLVTPERAARGKLPTDVWWHTIVSPTGREKTGYPTQKPEGVLRRIVQASSREGDWVLDFFAGSGTTGAVAGALGRNYVLVDRNEAAIDVIRRRLPAARFVSGPTGSRAGDSG